MGGNMMMIRLEKWIRRIILFSLAFVLLLAGCSQSEETPGNQQSGVQTQNTEPNGGQASGDPIKIGMLVSGTGFFSWYGVENLNAANMFAEAVNAEGGVNGRELELVIYDTASNPEKAITGAKKLIENDKVDAIVGLGLINETNAVVPMVKDKGPILYSLSGAYKPEGKYVFAGAAYSGLTQHRSVQWIKEQGLDSFALLTTNDDTGQQASAELTKLAEQEKLEITTIEYFNTDDVSVTTQLTKIKNTNPDAIIAWVVGQPLGVVFQGINQVGLDIPLLTSHGNLSYGFLSSVASIQPDEFYVPATKDMGLEGLDPSDEQYEKIKTFKERYSAQFNADPGLGSGAAWDALDLLVQAFKEAGTNPDEVAAYLESIDHHVGVAGTYDLSEEDHRGLGVDDIMMLRVVQGQIKPVE
jgi:branched-chain amino acid transport system substrate-binding protein